MSAQTTFAEAREILVRKHLEACMKIHDLVTCNPTATNNNFPELSEARDAEETAAQDIMRLNWVEGGVK